MEKDQEILNILLELEKNMVKNYATSITEASNDKLTEKFEDVFNESKKAQRELFNYMSNKGWYKLEYATENKISQEEKKNQKMLNELQDI